MRLAFACHLYLLATAVLALSGAANADQRDPRLPALFKELKATDDPNEGERIGRHIARIGKESGKDGIDEIMVQGNLHLALGNFTAVTNLEPRFAEGWNKRAAVLYRLGEFEAAMSDVEKALALEPRHFLALARLGVIYLRTGQRKEASRAFDVALQISPHLPVTRQIAEQITQRLEES